jgi:predicted amidophosphoribosyltransferase
LTRIRETRSQVGLSYDQRRANVQNAFHGNGDLIVNHKILVIDDVATSSSTMDACGAALKKAGAEQVYGLTLARAI